MRHDHFGDALSGFVFSHSTIRDIKLKLLANIALKVQININRNFISRIIYEYKLIYSIIRR